MKVKNGRNKTMKSGMLWTLGLCACFASLAAAQTVTGSGTTNTIPQFTGATTIGDSPIVQFNGSIGINSQTPAAKLEVKDFRDVDANGHGPMAIYGLTTCSLNNFCSAVRGDALTPGSGSIGVVGIRYGDDSGGGGGVLGVSFANTNFSYATRGDALGTSGVAVGVMGITMSPDGDGGRFVGVKGRSGTILRGDTGPPGAGTEVTVFRVDGTGRVFADGGFRPFGADFAEAVQVKGSTESYAPGDLLVIDASGERRLSKSQTPYSTLVAGIYSTQPGVVGSQHRAGEALPSDEVPLAVVGIVPCKVSVENGPVAVGDLLVTSSTPGYAMKGTDRTKMLGAVVGKALESLREGKGVVRVLVTLQ
jgi:hypothetical protein